MESLSGTEIKELRRILTNDEPLGPSNAEALKDSDTASRLLFDRQNAIYSELMNRSGILVGRRGAGKTAFLSQLRAAGTHQHVIFISAPDAFPEILRSIRRIFGDVDPIVEVVESLWDVLIWCCVFAQLLKKGDDARLQLVRNLANRLGFNAHQSPELVISNTIERLQQKVEVNRLIIDSPLRLQLAVSFENVSFADAKRNAIEVLKSERSDQDTAPVLVLMDTLENYKIELSNASMAVSGLLRFLGHQYANRDYLDIRFCLPTELYASFQKFSSNSMKDFSSRTILQWHAGDLLRVAAYRFGLFLRVHDPEYYSRIQQTFDLNRRDGASNFFSSLLPERVLSRGGIHEAPLAYVLRHTQLLPRHIIEIFNRVFTGFLSGKGAPVQDGLVTGGVHECEYIFCSGVITAFEHRYPHLQKICEAAIPELSRKFTDGDLRRAFTQQVKGVLKRLKSSGEHLDLEYHGFKKMLIEVGAIGKMTKETDVYLEAEFEYNVASELILSSDDMLCVHPLFSGVYPRTSELDGTKKPVYPHGSDLGAGATAKATAS